MYMCLMIKNWIVDLNMLQKMSQHQHSWIVTDERNSVINYTGAEKFMKSLKLGN